MRASRPTAPSCRSRSRTVRGGTGRRSRAAWRCSTARCRCGRPGPYQLQAAIAALHAKAATPVGTDWAQISALYAALYRALPTPVVALNAAAAFAMVAGPGKGLQQIDSLAGLDELRGYHLLPAARADLLRRAGRDAEARAEYVRALALARNRAERLYLERRLAELDGDRVTPVPART